MNKVLCFIIILCTFFLIFFGCFPTGKFHSLVDITLTNQSSYNVHFVTRRIGEGEEMSETDHGVVFAGTSNSFKRSSGYTYYMYCHYEDEKLIWGPQEIYIDFDQDYEWIIVDPEPLPTGKITVNNETDYAVNMRISGSDRGNINPRESMDYIEEIGSYDLMAVIENGPYEGQCWYNTIELTEAGYTWDLNINTEFYPSENCRVFNFENNYEDQNGIDDWSVKANLAFNSIKKFGNHALFATFGNTGYLQGAFAGTLGESQAMGAYIYFDEISSGNGDTNANVLWVSGDTPGNADALVIDLYYDSNFKWYFRFLVYKNGSKELEYIFPTELSEQTWHYVAFSYNINDDKLRCVVNNEIYISSTIGGTWETPDTIHDACYTRNNISLTGNGPIISLYIDEFAISVDYYIHPDIWVQHYNHNVPWGDEYIP